MKTKFIIERRINSTVEVLTNKNTWDIDYPSARLFPSKYNAKSYINYHNLVSCFAKPLNDAKKESVKEFA